MLIITATSDCAQGIYYGENNSVDAVTFILQVLLDDVTV